MSTQPPNLDVVVAYRVYPGVSKTPAIHADDKLRLAEVALASFRAALGDLRFKVYAVLDGCPDAYVALFGRYFSPEEHEVVRRDRVGNGATFDLQIELLLGQQQAEYVYFAEDDYVYRPGGIPAILEFMRAHPDVDFVTAYDHLDLYEHALHAGQRELIRAHGRHHWRTVQTTCLTFMARASALREAAPVFRTFARGNHDASLWLALTKRGVFSPRRLVRALLADRPLARVYAKSWLYTPRQLVLGRRFSLWSPMPSIATHLESRHLAPVVRWQEEFEKYPA